MTSSWFFLSTLNYDARSTTHQICLSLFLSYVNTQLILIRQAPHPICKLLVKHET